MVGLLAGDPTPAVTDAPGVEQLAAAPTDETAGGTANAPGDGTAGSPAAGTLADGTLADGTLPDGTAGTPADGTAATPTDGSAGIPGATGGGAEPGGTTAPAVTRKTVTVRKSVAFSTKRVNDGSLAKGKTKVRTNGVAGSRTLTYQVTLTGGKETGRTLVSDVVTRKPVTKVIAVGTKVDKPSSKCDPNYTPCVPIASDVDCAGGSGNGPAYVDGPVTIVGTYIYKLDSDDDGVGCES